MEQELLTDTNHTHEGEEKEYENDNCDNSKLDNSEVDEERLINGQDDNITINVEYTNDNDSSRTLGDYCSENNSKNDVQDKYYTINNGANRNPEIDDKKCTTDINDNSCRIETPSSQDDDAPQEQYESLSNCEDDKLDNNVDDSKPMQNGVNKNSNALSDDSLDSEEDEILKNTKFVDSEIPTKHPSRSRRSGVVNDTSYIKRMLSSSTNNSDDDLTTMDSESELNKEDHIPNNKDDIPDEQDNIPDEQDNIPDEQDNIPDEKDESGSPKHASFYIGSMLSNKGAESESDDKTDTGKPDMEEPASPQTDNSTDIYYEEGPKRLKRNTLESEDFSGAKTYQDKNKLIVKYPNRKVSFEHCLMHNKSPGEHKLSPLAIDVGSPSPSASPRTILKNPQRRSSYESHMYRHIIPTGHINYGYMHDEMKDKMEKRKVSMETAHYYEQESEIYNGNGAYSPEEDVESPKSPGIETGQFVKNESKMSSSERFSRTSENTVQNGLCKRSSSNEDFSVGDNKLYLTKRPSLIYDGEEFDIVNKNFSAHLRKDSLALTSEKLRQLETIHRHYNPCTYVEEPIWKQKLSDWKKYQLHICVISIFLALVSIVIIGWHFHNRTNKLESIGKRIFFDAETRELYLSNPSDNHRLTGMIGLNVPTWQLPFHCHSKSEKSIYTCLRWKDNAVLRISYFERPNIKCYNISWEPLRHDLIPFDCFDTGTDHWYGPGNQSTPTWPLTSDPFKYSASMSRHFDAGTFSSAIDYHWISSGGSAIFVPNDVALEVDWNIRTNKICLFAKYSGDFYGSHTLDKAMLNYTVCNGKDAVTTFKYTRTLMGKFPKTLPTTSVLQKPVWSFQVDGKTNSSEKNAIQLLQKIEEENLQCSVFEIAGQWQNRFGDLAFNNKTLSNLSYIAEVASSYNCGLSVEINPYFDVLSSNFKEGFQNGHFIKDSGSFAPGIVKWNNAIHAMLDVSKSTAISWMKEKLSKLKKGNGIQSFSVIYGKPFWVPYNPSFYTSNVNPSTLREMFSEMFSSATATLYSDIIQGTSNSQDIPYFLPVPTTIVSENGRECLTGVIERILALGIKGYPFVISDLLRVDSSEGIKIPSRELYIRWLQLSAFLPAMRYSIMPWEYDTNVVEIAQNITQLHKLYIAPTILSLKHEIFEGEPIIRPIWWVYPDDKEAFKISDEFLVGDNILVAPVMCENVQERAIYFPEGMWSDKSNGHLIQGKNWITYDVSEYKIPYFLRVKVLTTDHPT